MEKRIVSVDRRKLRNLKQYRDLPEDEFNDIVDKIELNAAPSNALEKRIERWINKFGEDYDLSDLKFNDQQTIRALAQASITLEDLEQFIYKLREEGINYDNLTLLDKVTQQMTRLRMDISKMQEDLKITRRIRSSDETESVVTYIESLKEKARKFYESKMFYIFCPKCNMLVSTTWFLWPDSNNKLQFVCKRKLENGEACNHKFVVTSKELLKQKGTNKTKILPESMR